MAVVFGSIRISAVLLGLCSILTACSHVGGPCTTDADCKSGRSCVSGACVDPPPIDPELIGLLRAARGANQMDAPSSPPVDVPPLVQEALFRVEREAATIASGWLPGTDAQFLSGEAQMLSFQSDRGTFGYITVPSTATTITGDAATAGVTAYEIRLGDRFALWAEVIVLRDSMASSLFVVAQPDGTTETLTPAAFRARYSPGTQSRQRTGKNSGCLADDICSTLIDLGYNFYCAAKTAKVVLYALGCAVAILDDGSGFVEDDVVCVQAVIQWKVAPILCKLPAEKLVGVAGEYLCSALTGCIPTLGGWLGCDCGWMSDPCATGCNPVCASIADAAVCDSTGISGVTDLLCEAGDDLGIAGALSGALCKTLWGKTCGGQAADAAGCDQACKGFCDQARCVGKTCGECQQCSGGSCVPASDGAGCSSDGDPCTSDTCRSGSCSHGAIANDCGGQSCGLSHSGCFQCGSCAQPGVCDPLEGRCTDLCQGLKCPECQACSQGACVSIVDGSACKDDGDSCTRDVCRAGACAHPAIANDCGSRKCGASPSGCFQCGACPNGRVCDPQSGLCNDSCQGKVCPDCQACVAGVCAPVADESSCTSDGDPCTADACRAGQCGHPPIQNDCGGRSCGSSPSDCFQCGSCPMGTCGCAGGACKPILCSPGATSCQGKTLLTCANDGCSQSSQNCAFQCDALLGSCCGGPGQDCCDPNLTCAPGLVCNNKSLTCQPDNTPTEVAYRYVNLCNSSHWESAANACFPHFMDPLAGCGGCNKTIVNPGCGAPTCWKREIAFHTYAQDPGWGSFFETFHCFQNGANTYDINACPLAIDNIGWMSIDAASPWSKPGYLCEWNTGVVWEDFFTLDRAECVKVGGAVLGDPWGYVAP